MRRESDETPLDYRCSCEPAGIRSGSFTDARSEMENCDICANDAFRSSWQETGVTPTAFEPPKAAPASTGSPAGSDQDALVQAITDRVMEALNKR